MLNEFIQNVIKDWKVPGAAVAVIENGVVTSTNYIGFAKVDTPVNENTLFAIGSTSKAFTATLAVLGFKSPMSLENASVSIGTGDNPKDVSLHELLTHTSGMAPHDFAWFGGGRPRSDLLAAVKMDGLGVTSKALNSGTFQYSNIGYCLVANALEKETSKSFEDLVMERILKPLEMASSGCDTQKLASSKDAAKPHILTQNDDVIEMEHYHNTEAVAPAGGLYSTLDDTTKWVLANLGTDSSNLLSKEVLKQLHTTHTTSKVGVPFLDPLWANPEIDKPIGYGYGWFTYGYRGERIVEHGGNIDGFSCLISMMPEKKSGVIVLTNLQGFPFHLAHNVIAYGAYDRTVFKGKGDPVDWNTRALSFSQMVQQGMKGMIDGNTKNAKDVEHENFDDFVGSYYNALYGDIVIRPNATKGSGLELLLNGRRYDFLALPDKQYWMVDPVLHPTGFVFTVNDSGELSATMEPTASPVVFTKQHQ